MEPDPNLQANPTQSFSSYTLLLKSPLLSLSLDPLNDSRVKEETPLFCSARDPTVVKLQSEVPEQPLYNADRQGLSIAQVFASVKDSLKHLDHRRLAVSKVRSYPSGFKD